LYNLTAGLLLPTPGKVLKHGVTAGAKNTGIIGLSTTNHGIGMSHSSQAYNVNHKLQDASTWAGMYECTYIQTDK